MYISIAYSFLFRFFQETFAADEEVVGVIFFNLDAIQKYQPELSSVKIAGVDGTFKPCLNVLLNLAKAAF